MSEPTSTEDHDVCACGHLYDSEDCSHPRPPSARKVKCSCWDGDCVWCHVPPRATPAAVTLSEAEVNELYRRWEQANFTYMLTVVERIVAAHVADDREERKP